ncbi:MAG: hypothetical protein QM692_03020 [Thermomicrobiales bacterium]
MPVRQPLVRVDRGTGNGAHALGVGELAADEMTRGGGEAIGRPRIAQEILAVRVAEQALEEMHAGARCLGKWFRHEGGMQPPALGDRADHLPRGSDLVGDADAARVTQVELLLAGAGFVVGAANQRPFLQAGHDLVAGLGEDILANIEVSGGVGGREQRVIRLPSLQEIELHLRPDAVIEAELGGLA